MKKQILILVFLVMAVFANVNVSYGQMVHNSVPIPLVCTTDATHPLAGVPYKYAVTATPAAGDFQWWATTDVDFIKTTLGVTTNNSSTKLAVGAAAALIATSANYGIAGGATNADNVDITWSSATLLTALTTPTFVVVQNDATGTNCANNLKVYKIDPVNGFTVDIKNMDQAKAPVAAYGDAVNVCISDVESASYAAGAIVTNYGTNVLYFEVVASNFTGGYTPFFQVSGLATGQSVTSLELAVATSFATPIATTLAAGAYSPAAPVTVDPSVINTTNGVSLYVRLTIANGIHENLTDTPITLAVNGTNSSNQKDVVNSVCATQTDYEDLAVQTLTLRPTVKSVPATGVFVTP